MIRNKRILIVFPDEWLKYSPSVINLYNCLERDGNELKLVYLDNGYFNNDGVVKDGQKVSVGKLWPYLFRKTLGYKLYKVLRLFFVLLGIRLREPKYDLTIAIDSTGFIPSRILFRKTVFYSLEVERSRYFNFCKLLGIAHLVIQSKERRDYLLDEHEDTQVHYIQNSPVTSDFSVDSSVVKNRNLLYMGNIDFRYGLEQFIRVLYELPDDYTLTLKGIRNEKFFLHLKSQFRELIEYKRLLFDFEYVDQKDVIQYTSGFYIGITGYDLELARKDFNYFSSPAGKLFNYYAAAVPVIGINIIGLRSVTDQHTGVLLNEVSPDTVKKAIQTIESDYAKYSANCLSAARAFDYSSMFNQFSEAITPFVEDKRDIKTYFTKGHDRSLKAKQNIITSVLIKCISIAISFILIPMTLNYLNPVKYGIWLTVTSVIGWFTFFDMGLGHGLQNKLAEALSKNDKESARIYVSTSYAILSLIILAVYLLFIIVFPLINWSVLLNTPPEMNEEINKLIFIVFSFFCLQFIIKLISMILRADQRASLAGGINTFASLLSLLIVFVITKTTHGSILWLSVGISVANLLSPLIASVWFFGREYSYLRPSWSHVRFSHARDLMGLGFLFFIMQFAGLVLFTTDSFIIDQLYGPEEVTPYNIAFKYFSVITMGFNIVTTPFWSAYTDAYHKGDIKWMRRITRKLMLLWLLVAVGVMLMLLVSEFIYRLWIGDQVQIPFILSACMALWVLISTWTSIFGNFLSGVGKIRLSLYHSVIVIIVNIPLSIFLATWLGMGPAGVILATSLCVLPQVVTHPVQYLKIISGKAKGIWNK